MKLLTRYLLRNNLFLLFASLMVGTGLYVLTDLFERLDYFLDASFGILNILWFYTLKVPFIVGQILPAVFLIAVIVQFCLMAKARETLALQSGGVSPFVFLRFVLFYGVVWAILQLALAQGLGVEGDRISTKIWRERIKGNESQTFMHSLWFVDNTYIVHLGEADPVAETGKGFLAYQISEDDKHMRQMIRATSFSVSPSGEWRLYDATVITPETYGYEVAPEMVIPLTQDLASFAAINPNTKPTHLPVWSLYDAISNLERSGSNVEVLRTTLHSRFAYAASLIVMGILGLATVLWRNNVYLAVGVGLIITFVFYSISTLCISLGEKGILPPLVAAWLPVLLFFVMGLCLVLWCIRPKFR